MGTCPGCGQDVEPDYAFCPSCSADLRVHPTRPPMPSPARQRGLALGVAAGVAIVVILVAVLLPPQVASTGASTQTSSTTSGFPIVVGNTTFTLSSLPTNGTTITFPTQTDAIALGNASVTSLPSPNSTSIYDLSVSVTNTGNVGIVSIEISITPPSFMPPVRGPYCTFSQLINATSQVPPGATVSASCTGSPYVAGGTFGLSVAANFSNGGTASWTGFPVFAPSA